MRITLCGSAKFEDEYHRWSEALIMEGHVVYSLAVFPSNKPQREWYIKEQKEMLDLVHLAKIDNSNCIVVINCEGDQYNKPYIGESTKREIKWASIKGKIITYTSDFDNDTSRLLDALSHPRILREGIPDFQEGNSS